MSLTARQKRRINRTQQAARRLRELESHRHSLVPVATRHPDYWRDLSVEIVGTILSAVLIFGFGRIFGYIERPSGRSEMLRILGLLGVGLSLAFIVVRVLRVRLEHRGVARSRLAVLYVRAVEPHWSLPALAVGVALCLGYV